MLTVCNADKENDNCFPPQLHMLMEVTFVVNLIVDT